MKKYFENFVENFYFYLNLFSASFWSQYGVDSVPKLLAIRHEVKEVFQEEEENALAAPVS
jgi:hypothetical protein